MVSGSHERQLVRSALHDIAAVAACNTSQPAPQQPAESSKPPSPSLSAITTQPPGRVPTDVSALNDLAKGMYGTYRVRMFRIRL